MANEGLSRCGSAAKPSYRLGTTCAALLGYVVKCFPDGYMKNTYVYFDRFDLHLPGKLRFFYPPLTIRRHDAPFHFWVAAR